MGAGELPTNWGHPADTTGAEPPDALLCVIVAPRVADPLPMPGWTVPAWRKAMQRPESAAVSLLSFNDARLGPLLAWVTSKTRPSQHLGAAAAALAVLDTAVSSGDRDVTAVARELQTAVLAVRPEVTRLQSQARTFPSPHLERQPDPASRTDPSAGRADSPFLSPAALLLRQSGYELRADAALADRMAAALDVVLAHWANTAQPGGGLPAFFAEGPLRSTKRLAVGSDETATSCTCSTGPSRAAAGLCRWRADVVWPTGWRSHG